MENEEIKKSSLIKEKERETKEDENGWLYWEDEDGTKMYS